MSQLVSYLDEEKGTITTVCLQCGSYITLVADIDDDETEKLLTHTLECPMRALRQLHDGKRPS